MAVPESFTFGLLIPDGSTWYDVIRPSWFIDLCRVKSHELRKSPVPQFQAKLAYFVGLIIS